MRNIYFVPQEIGSCYVTISSSTVLENSCAKYSCEIVVFVNDNRRVDAIFYLLTAYYIFQQVCL